MPSPSFWTKVRRRLKPTSARRSTGHLWARNSFLCSSYVSLHKDQNILHGNCKKSSSEICFRCRISVCGTSDKEGESFVHESAHFEPGAGCGNGPTPVPRTEIVKQLWVYIKEHDLQAKANKRNVNADAKLLAVFGKPQVTMFEMAGLISKHVS